MALFVNGSTHLIPAYFSFIDPERMKGWVGLVGWPIADGLPTLVVTYQLQVERKTGKVRQSETDVLPLCHATNLAILPCYLSLITIRISDWRQFCDIHISQGSVATYLRRGGIFKHELIANLLRSPSMKKVWKLVNIWWSYGQEFGVLFFDSQCRFTQFLDARHPVLMSDKTE